MVRIKNVKLLTDKSCIILCWSTYLPIYLSSPHPGGRTRPPLWIAANFNKCHYSFPYTICFYINFAHVPFLDLHVCMSKNLNWSIIWGGCVRRSLIYNANVSESVSYHISMIRTADFNQIDFQRYIWSVTWNKTKIVSSFN